MEGRTIAKWGIILGIAVSLGTQILTWIGLGLTNWFVLLTYVLVVVFVILSLKELKNRTKTTFNFLHAILSVIGIIVIARLLFQTYMYVHIHYIDPTWVETVASTWTKSLQETNVPANKIEQQIDSFRQSYETIPMFTSSLITYAVPQFVLGIIVSILYVFIDKKTGIRRSMKMIPILHILIVLLLTLTSCTNSTDNNSIRPEQMISHHRYDQDDFMVIPEGQDPDFFWKGRSARWIAVAVHIEKGELVLSERKRTFRNNFFELDDGILEMINHGEFGGALNFIPKDRRLDTVRICDMPINYVFEFQDDIYFLVGIPHIRDHGGGMFKLNRELDGFGYEEVLRLDSAPMAVAIYGKKILIAGYSFFTIVEDFKKENIPCCYQANSIAVKSEEEVYVGVRDGYVKLSLRTKEAEEFWYKESLKDLQ